MSLLGSVQAGGPVGCGGSGDRSGFGGSCGCWFDGYYGSCGFGESCGSSGFGGSGRSGWPDNTREFDDQKFILNGSMDFNNSKVCGDTSTFDGLV